MGGRGAEAPSDFKLMLLCVLTVAAKGHPKCIIIEKQERKKQLSGYKQCYTRKTRSVQIYEFGSRYMQET